MLTKDIQTLLCTRLSCGRSTPWPVPLSPQVRWGSTVCVHTPIRTVKMSHTTLHHGHAASEACGGHPHYRELLSGCLSFQTYHVTVILGSPSSSHSPDTVSTLLLLRAIPPSLSSSPHPTPLKPRLPPLVCPAL